MDEQPTQFEIDALNESRRRVRNELQRPAVREDRVPLVAGDGLSQRGNLIDAERRNPALLDNPLAGGVTIPVLDLIEGGSFVRYTNVVFRGARTVT